MATLSVLDQTSKFGHWGVSHGFGVPKFGEHPTREPQNPEKNMFQLILQHPQF